MYVVTSKASNEYGLRPSEYRAVVRNRNSLLGTPDILSPRIADLRTMKRNSQTVLQHWFSELRELEQTSSTFDVKSLIVGKRILLGMDLSDYAEEIEFALAEIAQQGYIDLTAEDTLAMFTHGGVIFKNRGFSFTGKFYDYKKSQLRKRKIEKLKPEIAFWATIVAAVASVVGIIVQMS